MFRRAPGLLAGLVAALLWLASGVLFGLIVWFGLYTGDVVRLFVAETVPVEIWHAGAPWMVLIPLASTLAFGGATAWAIGRVAPQAATSGSSARTLRFLASWMVVVLAGAAVGAAGGIGTLLGSGPPPRLAFVVQGLPDAVAAGLGAGLLLGWLPALIALGRARPATTASPTPAVTAPGVVAAIAALVLIASTAVVVSDARQAGLAGEAPSSVQQPQPDPVPTGTPPPIVAPGDHPIDPSWCTPSQLQLEAGAADAATGHRSAILVATNTGQDACVMPGYPDVAFADEHGVAVEAAVRYGGGFMTEDPGATPFALAPGTEAVARIAWDATDGRTVIPQLYLAPFPGAERTLLILEQGLDITAATEVAVTAWALADGPLDLHPAP